MGHLDPSGAVVYTPEIGVSRLKVSAGIRYRLRSPPATIAGCGRAGAEPAAGFAAGVPFPGLAAALSDAGVEAAVGAAGGAAGATPAPGLSPSSGSSLASICARTS